LYAPRFPGRARPRGPASAIGLALVLLAALFVPAEASAVPAPRPQAQTQLTTPWTHEVSPANALPDYPRPQLTRSRWQNLNGSWQFAEASTGETPPVGKDLADRVLVPYPVESALSGIQRHVDHMWYRRTFTVPRSWHGDRLLLHFQAVDYQAVVYVNGVQVATHTGGYDSFTADVTGALKGAGPQEVIVGVDDTTDIDGQPVGKQRQPGDGIFYTPSSGIWQTVWMEPVAAAHIDRIDTTPDLAAKALRLTVRTSGVTSQTVEATAYAGHRKVGQVRGRAGASLMLPVPHPHLWSPDDPYLYTLKVRILDRHGSVDAAGSYFGMRSIGLGKGPDGKVRTLLNGKFVMQVGTLDQGFWPDGIYTAPTDAALRFDLEAHKKLGFNMVRKHVKVEPDRWYYWADRLGLLVWQDMPSTFASHTPPASVKEPFEAQLHALVDQHRSHPSIITWVPFNEGWGEYEPGRIVGEIKAWDPSRLVNADSGVNCCDSLPDNARPWTASTAGSACGSTGTCSTRRTASRTRWSRTRPRSPGATPSCRASCCRSRSGAGSRRPSTPRSPTSRTSSTASTPMTAGCSSPAPTRYVPRTSR
jgi:beta-galactosidase/beta-glucuronidase